MNSWPKARLCAVGDAHLFLSEHFEAVAIYNEMLELHQDERAAYRGLGIVYLYDRKPTNAIVNLRKAWAMGEREALPSLGAAYVMLGDMTGMKDLLPDFMARKAEDPEILNTLLAYALKATPPDKGVFHQALEGVSDAQILRREDTTGMVVKGLEAFGDHERARRLLKLKAAQDKGMKG